MHELTPPELPLSFLLMISGSNQTKTDFSLSLSNMAVVQKIMKYGLQDVPYAQVQLHKSS